MTVRSSHRLLQLYSTAAPSSLGRRCRVLHAQLRVRHEAPPLQVETFEHLVHHRVLHRLRRRVGEDVLLRRAGERRVEGRRVEGRRVRVSVICVRAVCVRCACTCTCGARPTRHAPHPRTHAPTHPRPPRTHAPTHPRTCPHTRTHLRHVGELGARPVARVGEHMVEWLVAAVLQGVDVH